MEHSLTQTRFSAIKHILTKAKEQKSGKVCSQTILAWNEINSSTAGKVPSITD
jgi:hypothetical protein